MASTQSGDLVMELYDTTFLTLRNPVGTLVLPEQLTGAIVTQVCMVRLCPLLLTMVPQLRTIP